MHHVGGDVRLNRLDPFRMLVRIWDVDAQRQRKRDGQQRFGRLEEVPVGGQELVAGQQLPQQPSTGTPDRGEVAEG